MNPDDVVIEALLEIANEQAAEAESKKAERAALEARISAMEETLNGLKAQLANIPEPKPSGTLKLPASKGKRQLSITVTERDDSERIKSVTIGTIQ